MDILDEDDSFFVDNDAAEISVGSDVLVEDSFSSVLSGRNHPVIHSTPVKSRQPSLLPSTSAPGRPERVKCTHCMRTYANQRTLSVHMRMHAMKGKRKCSLLIMCCK